MNIWKYQYERKAWKKWVDLVKIISQTKTDDIICAHISDKKAIRREMQTVKNMLQNTIEEKNHEIVQKLNQASRLKMILEFLLQKRTYDLNNEYAMNKAGFVFRKWKKRYLNVKTLCNSLSKHMISSKYRKGLTAIKDYLNTSKESERINNKLINFFESYGSSTLKSALATWYRNMHLLERENNKDNINHHKDQINEYKKQVYQIKKRNAQKCLNILTVKSKKQLFDA